MITHISTRHDFSSLYFYPKLHICSWISKKSFVSVNLLLNSQKDKYKCRRVMWVWKFLSHFTWSSSKRNPDKYRIDCSPCRPIIDLRKQLNLGESGNDLDTKTIWFGHKKYLSNREIRSPLHWYLIFGEFTCFLESVIEKRIFVNIDEYLLIIEYM